MQKLDAGKLDLRNIVRPGDTIIWGQACAEPLTLTEALMAQRADLGGITVFLGSGFSDTLRPEYADHIRFLGMGAVGSNRRLAKAGVLDVLPCHVSKMESYVADEIGRAHV